MKMVSLKLTCNLIQEISCVPNTLNTMANCIGALVWQRDGNKSVVWVVDMSFCSANNKKQQGSK